MPLLYDTEPLAKRVENVEEDSFKQHAIQNAQDSIGAKRNQIAESDPLWDEKCNQAAIIRDHVLDNLDYYIKEFVTNAESHGAQIHFAPKGEDAINEILDIIKETGETSVIKSKSMMSEEIGVDSSLEEHGIKVTETDCAENILQTCKQPPSHIVVPALHLDRSHIRDVYRDTYGYKGSDDPQEITHFLRHLLRPVFLSGHVGITGCNFGIAQTGTCTLVTNEGNARMVSGLPETLIVVLGIDRLLPDLDALDIMNSLLVGSAVGAKMTSSLTLNTGKRHEGEADGPVHMHIVMVNNGRSKMLGGTYQKMLRCIRCGACMNICPVYRQITGHGYGSIYPGPMGIVLTPQLQGYKETGELPYACSLCGGCASVCPMKIPINSLILSERYDMVQEGDASGLDNFLYKTAGKILGNTKKYNSVTKKAARIMQKKGKDGRLESDTAWVPVLKGWTQTRDLRNVQKVKFRDQFAAYEAQKGTQQASGAQVPTAAPTTSRGQTPSASKEAVAGKHAKVAASNDTSNAATHNANANVRNGANTNAKDGE